MTAKQHLKFWGIATLLFLLCLWALRDVLLPFVLGLAIAYFLDPLTDKFEKRMSRTMATVFVLTIFMTLFAASLALITPLIHYQLVEFFSNLPGYIKQGQAYVMDLSHQVSAKLSPEMADKLKAAVESNSSTLAKWGTNVLKNIWSSSSAIFDLISVILITPVVAFYMLRDWDRMIDKIDSWLPRKSRDTIRDLAFQIDQTLAGFLRGQALVCISLGLFYGIGLSIVGLKFGLIIGLLTGLIAFIPYVGSMVGFAASVGVAYFQYPDLTPVLIVAGIFGAGQMLEGNVLTPKLVGDKIGLHAVWVMFALMAGGSLMGFVGVMIAVPISAIIGVMVRFSLAQYLKSGYYEHKKPAAKKKKTVAKRKTA